MHSHFFWLKKLRSLLLFDVAITAVLPLSRESYFKIKRFDLERFSFYQE